MLLLRAPGLRSVPGRLGLCRRTLSTTPESKSWTDRVLEVYRARVPEGVRKSLREPTPSVAGIQQLGGFSILLSYMTTDILWLRGLAITGILAFNMIP